MEFIVYKQKVEHKEEQGDWKYYASLREGKRTSGTTGATFSSLDVLAEHIIHINGTEINIEFFPLPSQKAKVKMNTVGPFVVQKADLNEDEMYELTKGITKYAKQLAEQPE